MNLPDEKSVLQAVADETGYSVEQVHMVVYNLWKGVKYYLTNPHLIRAGLYLHTFISINLSVQRLETFVNRAMFGHRTVSPMLLDYVKEILKANHEQYRSSKKSTPLHNIQKQERLEGHIGRERCYVRTEEGTFSLFSFKELKRRDRNKQRKQRIEDAKK